MKRLNLTLALAAVLCIITAVIGFGGDYINSLFRSWSPSQALVASAQQPATEAPPAAAEPESQWDESRGTVYITRTGPALSLHGENTIYERPYASQGLNLRLNGEGRKAQRRPSSG